MNNDKFKSVPFQENEIYTVEMAASILHRCPKTIRDMCRRGVLASRRDRGGYFITGWAIRAYAEGRLIVNADSSFVK